MPVPAGAGNGNGNADSDGDAEGDDDDHDFEADSASASDTDSAREGEVPPLRGADASHAWVAVYAPPFGWLGFDPTNDVRINQDHVALAWGRDFGDVSPLRGVILGGGSHKLRVRVAVRRIEEPA